MNAADRFFANLLHDLAQRSTDPTSAAAFERAAQAIEANGIEEVRRQFAGDTPGPLAEQIITGARQ